MWNLVNLEEKQVILTHPWLVADKTHLTIKEHTHSYCKQAKNISQTKNKHSGLNTRITKISKYAFLLQIG